MEISGEVIKIIRKILKKKPRSHRQWPGDPVELEQCLEWKVPRKYLKGRFKITDDKVLIKIREMVKGYPVYVYKGGNGIIVVAPLTNPYDVMRLEGTQGNNHTISTEDLILNIKKLDSEFGIEITGITYTSLQLNLLRIPEGEEASKLWEKLYKMCPSIEETLTKIEEGFVELWWD